MQPQARLPGLEFFLHIYRVSILSSVSISCSKCFDPFETLNRDRSLVEVKNVIDNILSIWILVVIMTCNKTHTPAGSAVTSLILEVFSLNGQLLAAGDQLTKRLGLTSARWQVLGAIALAGQALSVAQIGRRMGLSRQAVQRVANDLQTSGFVVYGDNPDHKRASLVTMTSKGQSAFEEMERVQANWANELASGLDAARLEEAVDILREVQKRCGAISVVRTENSSQ